MNEIRFDFVSSDYKSYEVFAEEDGSALVITDGQTGIPVELSSLKFKDLYVVIGRVADWILFYEDLGSLGKEYHPADDAFGAEYVRGLNEDMGK